MRTQGDGGPKVTGAKGREAGVAILGAGFMGVMHAAALRQLQVIGDQDEVVPRLVAVAEQRPARRRAVGHAVRDPALDG